MPNEISKNEPKNKPGDGDKGPPDQAIGRPAQWREGRYEKDGASVDQSVVKKPGEVPPDTTSTPVTQEDYERIEK